MVKIWISRFYMLISAFLIVMIMGSTSSFAERVCGNGVLDAGEFCDPGMNQPLCSTASLLFSSGTLRCQSKCEGYDTTECVISQNSSGTRSEAVIPKFRDDHRWSGAICNYGNPFSFEVSLAPQPTKNWVIYLSGGGQCDGIIFPCTNQNPGAFYPADDIEQIHESGFEETNASILSRSPVENPDFYNANFAKANYCTSDLWSGTRTTPINLLSKDIVDGQTVEKIMPMTFAGRNNVRAMFETLKSYYGINDRDPDLKIMFTGSSAGGVGVNVSADLMAEIFEKTAKARRIYVVSSAGSLGYSWNDPNYTLNGTGYSDENAFEMMYNQYQAQVSDECKAMAVKDGKSPSICLSGIYTYMAMTKKMNFRVLLHRNILDQIYMNTHLLPVERADLSNAEVKARNEWEKKLKKEFKNVKWFWSPVDPQVSIYDEQTQKYILQNNFHGGYRDNKWDDLPPTSISANTCGNTPPVSFQEIIRHLWTDTSTSNDNDPGERYCYEGNWVQ